MWSSVYDNVLFALAFFEFAHRPQLAVDGFHTTERYGSYADCNGTRYLSTRILPLRWLSAGALEPRSMFHWALRAPARDGADARGVVHQVGDRRMAHNLALACVDDVLYAYGGTDARNTFKEMMGDHDGVYRARVRLEDGALLAPERVLTGKHEGCVERRLKFSGVCEFDGKFSVVQDARPGKPSRMLFYARANTVAYHGGRHVQVTESLDGGRTWGSFQLLDIQGVRHSTADNNVYFFVGDVWNTTHLVGTYPAVLEDGTSGVFASWSDDGVRWTRPQRVAQGEAFGQRVELFPVGVRDGRVHVMHVNLLNDVTRKAHPVRMLSYPLGGDGDGDGDATRVVDYDVDALQLYN